MGGDGAGRHSPSPGYISVLLYQQGNGNRGCFLYSWEVIEVGTQWKVAAL